ncbi:MAG: ribosome maturation factor RimP [Deltaproteobacteria bacterium]|jgi:ribosome maturation factor RimP|nr:ribosome maturation factor RimP [Deltaproteobacteria bacterium]
MDKRQQEYNGTTGAALLYDRAGEHPAPTGDPLAVNSDGFVVEFHPVGRRAAELVEPYLEREGFELVAVEFKSGGRGALLRLLVDRRGGGIDMRDLERLSPLLSDLLDVYDPVPGRYILEVSSPGISRPLTRLSHFRAYSGRRVRVRLHAARQGRKNFVGRLRKVAAQGIELEDEQSGAAEALLFGEIKSAHYEHQFN